MRKLLIICIIAMSTQAIAQTRIFTGGLILGINGTQVDGDTQYGYKHPGINAGVVVDVLSDLKLSFETGLMINGKGAVKKNDDYTEFKTNLLYAEIPLMIRFRILPKIKISAGISEGILINSKITDNTGAEEKNPQWLKKNDTDIIAGMSVAFCNKYELRAKWGYSLSPITEDADMPYWRNNYIRLSLMRFFN